MGDGKDDYDTIKAHLQASINRLGLEHVDLYCAHRVISLEKGLAFAICEGWQKLQDEGLIKEVGFSEVSGKWLRQIYTEGCPIAAVQQEWSLLTRNLETELVPVCQQLGVTIVVYSPLARNVLVQKWRRLPAIGVAPNNFIRRKIWPRIFNILTESRRLQKS